MKLANKDLGDLNNWTKNDLARVIWQNALKSNTPPEADDIMVQHISRQTLKVDLVKEAEEAIENINQR